MTDRPRAQDPRRAYFDDLYRDRDEPWDYSQRGAEVLRHELVVRTAGSLTSHARRRILDAGCSLGQLTSRLSGLGAEVHAFDLSPMAVRQARQRCLAALAEQPSGSFHFCVASVTGLPARPASFDLVLLCDGLFSWRLSDEEKRSVLRQANDVLAPGGHVILTDALKHPQIQPFIDQVRDSPLEVRSVRLLNDRLWFSLQRALRPVQHRELVQRALASPTVARALTFPARLAGRRGSKHVMIVAGKPAAPAEPM